MSRKPCAECPFARSTPGGATGGTCPTVYVGQSEGPFFLPCHMDPSYQLNRRSPALLQCAGAAIYRTHIGSAELMPPELLTLPEDHERVFSNHIELVAHHMRISPGMAAMVLIVTPPQVLLAQALAAAGVTFYDRTKIRKEG